MERIVAGIDLGSGSAKAVLLGEDKNVLARAWAKTRADFVGLTEGLLRELLDLRGMTRKDLAYVATTGLGRYAVPFRNIQITEITCGARGAWFLFSGTTCVLDIGSQSTRAIRVSDKGRVREFKTNEKCAAGSGSFLEKAAKYLETTVDKMGTLSLVATDPQKISSICAVLAESEIISHVSDGHKVPDIVRGIHDSLADRAATLLKRVGIGSELTFIGGVARQEGMIATIQEKLGIQINVPDEPDYVCALGAALFALERLKAAECRGAGASRSLVP
ncbi:MAG: 2-hydroxyglutaryl-CoA dehydratase [Elusimicrobia bacterium]|nr:2-hydroxyglutaryl-CoA dehydratase [Elusimicrobiota bacterium]